MKCRLFNLLTTLSLLLCVAVVVLWMRSYWKIDGLYGESDSHYYEAYAWRGGLWYGYLCVHAGSDPLTVPYTVARMHFPNPQLQLLFEDIRINEDFPGRAGFAWAGTATSRLRLWVMPLWLPAVLLTGLPALRLLTWHRRARNIRRGLCPSCNYNLTGNTSGVCPECGKSNVC